MIVVRLALAQIRHRPGRFAMTALAMVAAAAVVVWVVSGYDALAEKVSEVGVEYLGRYDAAVSAAALGEGTLAELRGDPDVVAVEPVIQTKVVVFGPRGVEPSAWEGVESEGDYGAEGPYIEGDSSPAEGRHVHERPPVLVATTAKEPPRDLVEGRWLEPPAPVASGLAPAVLTSGLAERLGATVGGEVLVRVNGREERVGVVGVVPETLAASVTGETVAGPHGALDPRRGAGPAGAALYVGSSLFERVAGSALRPNLASIAFAPRASATAFRARWGPRLDAAAPRARLITRDDIRELLAQSATTNAARMQAYAATGISLLAALFIIFSTLSMGVTERMRELAVLRATALTRSQTAGLIAVEALLLAVLGWLGGLAAGWVLLSIAAHAQPAVFSHGFTLGSSSVALSGACALVGALAAAVGPAWTAARVDLVAALGARPAVTDLAWVGRSGAVGAALVALSPVVLEVLPLADRTRALLFALVGCPALALGFLLLCPPLVVAVERLLGEPLSRVLGIPPGLLRSQLASNVARTVGTAAALSIGLGLFVTIQVWGRSMLGPFLPGAWAPGALVSIATCLPASEAVEIARLPEIVRVEALAVEQPRLADDITGSVAKGASVVRQDNVILLGVDPDAVLGGARPLFDLTFLGGTREEALARLRAGRHAIVPDHFARAAGLGIGSTFRVVPPADPTATVEYTVAGVVSLPGWHFVTKSAGLRRRFPRAAALVFAGIADVRRDFRLDASRIDALGLELRPGTDEAALRAALEPITANYLGQRSAGGGLAIMTPDAIRRSLLARTGAILWGASQLPLITLLVTSLGVVNAIVASIRARRWELGVLRAIGVTRSVLVRMVLAEASLVGVVACALSLGFGFSASWCGVAVAQYVSFFGGLAPPLVVPWGHLAGGVGATLGLCLLGGLWPAVSIGRSDTLALLAAGRSTA